MARRQWRKNTLSDLRFVSSFLKHSPATFPAVLELKWAGVRNRYNEKELFSTDWLLWMGFCTLSWNVIKEKKNTVRKKILHSLIMGLVKKTLRSQYVLITSDPGPNECWLVLWVRTLLFLRLLSTNFNWVFMKLPQCKAVVLESSWSERAFKTHYSTTLAKDTSRPQCTKNFGSTSTSFLRELLALIWNGSLIPINHIN